MIKYLDEGGKETLRDLINGTVKEQKTPEEWNTGIILWLYKNGDKRKCNNYRGITLREILARIVEGRIKKEFDKRELHKKERCLRSAGKEKYK